MTFNMQRTLKVLSKGACSFSSQIASSSLCNGITNNESRQKHMMRLLEKGAMPMKLPCAALSSKRLSTLSKWKLNWNEMYETLKEYRKENGDCLVPINYPKLGPWVERQRFYFRHLEESTKSDLDEVRRESLNDIDFVWEGETHSFLLVSWTTSVPSSSAYF